MLVRMLCLMAGPTLMAQPGQVIEVDDALGAQLVAGRYADLVADAPAPVRMAVVTPPETAVGRRKRGR